MEKRLTRRSFLVTAATALSGALLAACAPQVVKETVVVEKEVEKEKVVKETVVVEGTAQVVEKVVTTTPVPFTGKITHQIGGFYPSESMEWSETNTNPINMILTLMQEYKDLHPGVEIELVETPPSSGVSAREWIVTNMTADTIPDLVGTLSRDQVEEVAKGWWVALDPYLELPNDYVPAGQEGHDRWQDLFFQVPFESQRVLGFHYNLPYDIVTSMMFYNKDIFEAVGVEIPETVAELLTVFQKLQDAGHVAYGGIGSWFMYETLGQMAGSLMAHLTPQVNPNGGSSTYEEVACAIDRGIFRAETTEYREWMRIMKEIAAYRTPDWIDKEANAISKWLNGQIVVVEDGTWRIGENKKNPNLAFQWGMFYAPKVTQETSPVATGAPCPAIGGATGDAWGITKGALRDKNVDLCVDWLMFLSAPQNAQRLINERGATVPIEYNAQPEDPDLITVLENLKDTSGEDAMWTYYDRTDMQSRTDIWDIKNQFILDEVEMDDAIAQIDEIMIAYAQSFISEHEVDCEALGFSA